ncbi:MAG: hypothetical protein CO167_04250, partial [Candidatus Marinimicrobia bacterium CG_4_9_14_3_um_filter_48_9]
LIYTLLFIIGWLI